MRERAPCPCRPASGGRCSATSPTQFDKVCPPRFVTTAVVRRALAPKCSGRCGGIVRRQYGSIGEDADESPQSGSRLRSLRRAGRWCGRLRASTGFTEHGSPACIGVVLHAWSQHVRDAGNVWNAGHVGSGPSSDDDALRADASVGPAGRNAISQHAADDDAVRCNGSLHGHVSDAMTAPAGYGVSGVLPAPKVDQ